MSGSARPWPVRLLEVAGVGVVIVLALVAILTALRTELPRSPGVMSDALGPDRGEPVADYLDRAAASLAVGGDGGGDGAEGWGGGDDNDDNNDDDNAPSLDPDAPRWALISAAQAWTVADADAVARDLPRVSGLTVQVPVDGVAMPVTEVVLAEPVAGEGSRGPVFDRGLERVAGGMEAGVAERPDADGSDAARPDADQPDTNRAAAAAALTASRIRSGAPAIIGMIVRATPAQLRAVAQQPEVRVVEALPPDAVWGRFAVRPLQPQQLETASPLPDSDPIPAR